MTAFIGATSAWVGSTGRIWADAHKTIALAITSIGVTPRCSTISRSRHVPAASAITITRAAALSNVSRPAGVANVYSTCVFGRASKGTVEQPPLLRLLVQVCARANEYVAAEELIDQEVSS